MKRNILAVSSLIGLSLTGLSAGHAEEVKGPFSANVSLTSDYAYRGISQTDERPAIQGGFGFEHDSGFYASLWGSSISWLHDMSEGGAPSSSLELDISGGYKRQFGDFGLDAGLLYYYYPGSYKSAWKQANGMTDPHTLEGYVGGSWKYLSLKYSHSFTDLFGAQDTRNSKYIDFSVAYPVMDRLTLDGHFGRQFITGHGNSYNDWKLGATFTYRGFGFGLHYVDTNIDNKDEANADARFIVSVSKAF
ncbi:TorF family putative porin [Oxalobacter paraformigenes]|uniref:Uncharacterized protein n=1 Tax=Oxalobacter paraformigenes TaxID=556268 RepID=C3X1I9_9BURK|nr:TorF family putative porin [Oxalobacter paraformigenes]EEO27075.2 hypothetical protein OFAG_00228 [Oxalobacter paraformigenes]